MCKSCTSYKCTKEYVISNTLLVGVRVSARDCIVPRSLWVLHFVVGCVRTFEDVTLLYSSGSVGGPRGEERVRA